MGQIPAGAKIVIAPMGGFEIYFAATNREKKVPVTLTLDRDLAQYFVVSSENEGHGFVAASGAAANWPKVGAISQPALQLLGANRHLQKPVRST